MPACQRSALAPTGACYSQEFPQRARTIRRSEARRAVVLRYLDNVVVADRKMIAKVFHVVKWTSKELDRTLVALLEEDVIREIEVEGLEKPQLISTRALT